MKLTIGPNIALALSSSILAVAAPLAGFFKAAGKAAGKVRSESPELLPAEEVARIRWMQEESRRRGGATVYADEYPSAPRSSIWEGSNAWREGPRMIDPYGPSTSRGAGREAAYYPVETRNTPPTAMQPGYAHEPQPHWSQPSQNSPAQNDGQPPMRVMTWEGE